MIYTVLVVDDSNFFQQRLKEIINRHPQLKVVGIATNGQEAIELDDKLKPDVISMDYEMPLLDGVSAVRAILAKRKVPIVMFSSLTYEGARITLDALEAGAVDFISKNFAEISQSSSRMVEKLHSTLLAFAQKGRSGAVQPSSSSVQGASRSARTTPESAPSLANHQTVNTTAPSNLQAPHGEPQAPLAPPAVTQHSVAVTQAVPTQPAEGSFGGGETVRRPSKAKILVIGASTGGPVAVNEVLGALPADYPLPIVVIQHMPPNFTRALAERLDRVCNISVKEAETSDKLMPGRVLIGPGGYQLMFDGAGAVKLVEGDERMNYKPSLDIAFASAANHFGSQLMGVVLTGMGSDGCDGAKILKQKGGVLWSQDQASCVVYGMPKAVAEAGLSDCVLSLRDIGPALARG